MNEEYFDVDRVEKETISYVRNLMRDGKKSEAVKALDDLESKIKSSDNRCSADVYYYKLLIENDVDSDEDLVEKCVSEKRFLADSANYRYAVGCDDSARRKKIIKIEEMIESRLGATPRVSNLRVGGAATDKKVYTGEQSEREMNPMESLIRHIADEPVAKTAPTSPFEAVLQRMDNESRFRRGQIITAVISQANEDGLLLLLPFSKKEVPLSKDELDCEEYDQAEWLKKIGDQIDLLVVDVHPPIKLSQKMIRLQEEENALIEEIKKGKEFSIECTGTNKGGLTGSLGQYVVFVPAKEIHPGFVKDFTQYVGKTLRLRAIEIKKESRRYEIVASQRIILQEERDARDAVLKETEDAFYSSHNVGDVVHGKVVRIVDFGAFVTVADGVDGLIHISQLSNRKVENPGDVVKVGEEVDAKIIRIDPENHRLNLSLRALLS